MIIIANIIKYLTCIRHCTKSFTHGYIYRNLIVSTAVGRTIVLTPDLQMRELKLERLGIWPKTV